MSDQDSQRLTVALIGPHARLYHSNAQFHHAMRGYQG